MSPTKLVIGGIAAIAAVVVYRTLRTAQALDVSLRNLSLQFGGGAGTVATIGAQLRVINPTPFSASFKLPYVRILVNGETVGRSIPTEANITIAANSDTSQGPIRVPLNTSELLVITNAMNARQPIELELSEMRHNNVLLPTRRFPVSLDSLGFGAARSIAATSAKTEASDVMAADTKAAFTSAAPSYMTPSVEPTRPARPEPVATVEPSDSPIITPFNPAPASPVATQFDRLRVVEYVDTRGGRTMLETVQLEGLGSPIRNAR